MHYTSSGKDRTRKPRVSAYDRGAPALRYIDRHDEWTPDDRPQHVLSAYVCDPARSMAFTGETVGNATHAGGPTTHKRQSRKLKPVSTLTDHVTQNRKKWLPKPGPVTNPSK